MGPPPSNPTLWAGRASIKGFDPQASRHRPAKSRVMMFFVISCLLGCVEIETQVTESIVPFPVAGEALRTFERLLEERAKTGPAESRISRSFLAARNNGLYSFRDQLTSL